MSPPCCSLSLTLPFCSPPRQPPPLSHAIHLPQSLSPTTCFSSFFHLPPEMVALVSQDNEVRLDSRTFANCSFTRKIAAESSGLYHPDKRWRIKVPRGELRERRLPERRRTRRMQEVREKNE